MTAIAFGSNLGAPDLLRMFTHPEEWTEARSRIFAFRFAAEHIMAGTEPGYLVQFQKRDIGAREDGTLINTFAALREVNAFKKVNTWGKKLALGCGAIKPGDCEARIGEAQTLRNLDRIHDTGAFVDYLIIDSPIHAATVECGLTPERAAELVALFTHRIKTYYPDIAIGFVDNYRVPVAQWIAFMAKLRELKAAPAFASVDVDRNALREENWWRRLWDSILNRESEKVRQMRKELALLFAWLDLAGISSVIEIWGQMFTDAASYRANVLAWARLVRSLEVQPKVLMVESWEIVNNARAIPHNLGTGGHLQIVNEIARIFE